jgi:hypothetical protein
MWSTRYSRQILNKLEFSQQVFENPQTSNFMKIRPKWAELFSAVGKMTKLIVVFCHFANAPKNCQLTNILGTDVRLNYIRNFSAYQTLCYKNQQVNVVYGNNIYLLRNHTKHIYIYIYICIYIVWEVKSVLMLQLVVHTVTIRL